ncbi:MAG: TonB-dependent receptor [Myxococcota bacterium]
MLAAASGARAEEPPDAGPSKSSVAARAQRQTPDAGATLAADEFELSTTVSGARQHVPEQRASSTVRRTELQHRQPRSAPDALRYEPGVFVQQTAHAQASAFVRGLTGQQTVLVFDGLRLNTSTYRQGPNQYFFTLDAATIASVEVLRGGGSTWFGSDALGGVVATQPVEPPDASEGPLLRPTFTFRGASADGELGGRFQLEAALGRSSFLGGVGARRVGLLQSSGPVTSPADGSVPDVPRFDDDGRTQLGTGFNELTGDARFRVRVADGHSLTAALYAYRQFDAPRTDQCPPPGARSDECLTYTEQFRTLAYAAWDGAFESGVQARAAVSWQRQHERRENARPASFVLGTGRDVVDTFGATLRVQPRTFTPRPWLGLTVRTGVDTWVDLVDSRAWLTFDDIGVTQERSRGQYLAGSSSVTGGAWVDLEAAFSERWTARSGARVAWAAVQAPADPESGSAAVAQRWFPLAGHVGLEWRALRPVSLVVNLDRSFRAPNLDDLSSRQQTGAGFQFENPRLEPETATTLEAGARVRTAAVTADAWLFQTWLAGAVGKQPREVADCPPQTPACNASWNRFQLVNAPGVADVRGVEAALKLRLPWRLGVRATASWTWGEGPNLVARPADPSAPWTERVPLSRIPPFNGTAELTWQHPAGLGAAAALRWATLQDRLAVADFSDARIPAGGTPGYAVVDMRVWAHLSRHILAVLVLENLFDTPWRAHGSSVNGPGRGVIVSLSVSP